MTQVNTPTTNLHAAASRAQATLRPLLLTCVALFAIATAPHAHAQAHGGDTGPQAQTSAAIHIPSDAVRAPRVTERYTADGMTQNPVAITFDHQGNIYVAEAWRQGHGVIAIVNIPGFQNGDLQSDLQRTTVAQREANIDDLLARGAYPPGYFTDTADQVRLLRDTDGDGVADNSSVFAGGFNGKAEGNASGVLYLDGKLYLTNIPNVWLLQDRDGDGDADAETDGERTSLSYGYGLRWSYSGHDMHGLIRGHDGRIYFSIGDRGYNVTNQEGQQLVGLNHGAVFRMWPDGSELEVFYTGLRNPQELAFDNYGNLFTGDNNSDAGDLARFCYLPEGGDSGWRQDVQTIDSRGPWNRERMWEPRLGRDELIQPAWIIPPLANVGRGPSGLAHYPGTGDAFPANGSFLMCDSPAGVRHVQLAPSGADFTVTEDSTLPVGGTTITDVAWGYDGRLYLSDWGGGWSAGNRGWISTMTNEAAHAQQAEVIAEVEALFAEGFGELSNERLIELLGHRDQRVRLAAQWEAAKRTAILGELMRTMIDHDQPELRRLHALWAIGMQQRQSPSNPPYFAMALADPSPNVRAQIASLIGDLGLTEPAPMLIELLEDPSPIVQHHAAIALGKLGDRKSIVPLLDLLERNDNNDAVLRHAASYALFLIGDAEAIDTQAKRRGSAARLGAVLALRRLESPLIIGYLEDADPLVAAEAARAIYDQRIMEALPALAALADTLPAERMTEPVMRRVIEANVRLADADSAARIAKIAANPQAPDVWRALALQELTDWSAPRDRDGVWGRWWPRPTQTMQLASDAMLIALPAIKETATGQTLTQARVFELTHILNADQAMLAALARDDTEPNEVRMAGMQMLAEQDRGAAVSLAEELLAMPSSAVVLRQALRRMVLPLNREVGERAYVTALEQGTMPEQQEAIRALALIRTGSAQQTMSTLSEQLLQGTLAPELRLDVYEMLMTYRNLPVPARNNAQRYGEQNTLAGDEPFIRDAILAGGSIEAGRAVFESHPAAQCMRCHRLDNQPSAGPNLTGVGSAHDMQYLYTALVHPSHDIAKGFESTAVTLTNGSLAAGRIDTDKSTAETLVLIDPSGTAIQIPRSQIAGQPTTDQVSMMPQMTTMLSPDELRDVLAFLASLKADPNDPTTGYLAAGATHRGATLRNPAKDLQHIVWLPAMLLTTGGGLFLLLVATMLLSRKNTPDTHD